MNIEISCLHCGDFFKLIPGEAEEFIENRADKKYLRKRNIPKHHLQYFRTRKNFIKHLIEYHCPYCREVVFGEPLIQVHSKGHLSEDKYLKEAEKEMRQHGGFRFYQIV